MIYFDNASTSFPKPVEVGNAVFEAINTLGSPSRGTNRLSLSASRVVYETRMEIAKLFNLEDPLNVAFTQNITESLNAVIKTMFNSNDHIITTEYEHNAVLRPLYETGCELDIIPYSHNDILDYKKLKNLIKPNTKAIISTHCSNVTGDIIDIKYLGQFAKENGLLFIVDAAQTAGFLDINLKRDFIDILCFTGHKSLYGSQGTGGICINTEKPLTLKPFKSGGSGSNSLNKNHPNSMPDVFEAGTQNVHSIAGLLAGLKFIEKIGIANIYEKEIKLVDLFYNGIKDLPNIKIYGSFSDLPRCPVVSFNIGLYDSQDIATIFSEKYDICCRGGVQCSPLIHKALKTESQGTVRFSFSYFNNEDEVKTGLKAVNDLAYGTNDF